MRQLTPTFSSADQAMQFHYHYIHPCIKFYGQVKFLVKKCYMNAANGLTLTSVILASKRVCLLS